MDTRSATGDAQIDWLARRFARDRRARYAFFRESDIFGEPMWDMLLELFIAARDGREVSVTSACIATRRPHAEALACLDRLIGHALVRRDTDIANPAHDVVALTGRGVSTMADYFGSLLPDYPRRAA
ncbi:hypothetical protein [Novosphingobium album (ex Liu et al. 2023)]|uniref:MarR family transcriptional regulator n=1 Tax=Novosphingobium album (ex Liu et al. 2023) TaxID=3031130 RepID=A0ABT5WT44_9SPHN|nr:hypothetical protein [Novosphingobium album (ex Liu et al. 2023)]MDE8653099.1 hypothetical protein [Novosphingobium album (ex Liu et al. 2023)]